MLLIDAVYINKSGGKVLLDYLIETLERTDHAVFYLLDERIRNNHPRITPSNHCQYMVGSLARRHAFYHRHGNAFDKIFCFGNLPPNIRVKPPVYTYFHQLLFLACPPSVSPARRLIIGLKAFVVSRLKNNTNYWIVQSGLIRRELIERFHLQDEDSVKVIPFYPPLPRAVMNCRISNRFVYISSGTSHKNHERLIHAFQLFYDKHRTGELHLTVGKEYGGLCSTIDSLRLRGYPVINHGSIGRDAMAELYASSEYCVYPSLAESFGLGIVEALECGCKIIGADRPYLNAACEPSGVFDPESITGIAGAMEQALWGRMKPSRQKLFSQMDQLLEMLH